MNDGKDLQAISGVELIRMKFPQNQYCIQDVLPKGLNVLFSVEMDCARSLAMGLALRVVEGESLWGKEVQRGPVLYMVHKDTLAATRNRLVSMTKRVPDALYIGVMTESTMELVLSAVPEFMESNPELSLVVVEVDTPVAYMSHTLYAPGELQQQYTSLKELAEENNITILIVQKDVQHDWSLRDYGVEKAVSISEEVNCCFELDLPSVYDNKSNLKRTSRIYGNDRWKIKFSRKPHRWRGTK